MRSVQWADLPFIIDYTVQENLFVIESVTPPTQADVDAYIAVNKDAIKAQLMEDYKEDHEQTL